MSELNNTSVNDRESNNSSVEIEEIEESPSETFRDVFGESSIPEPSMNRIVEKVEDSESIKEIQKAIREKFREFAKNDIKLFTPFFAIVGFTPLTTIFPFFLAIALNLAYIVWFMIFSYKTIAKSRRLNNQLDHLFKKLIQLKLNGKILEQVSFNSNWGTKKFDWKNIKIQKNDDNTIVEYMVKGSLGKKNEPSIEIKEVK